MSVTIKDVARRAGVSVGTVSRYLNGAGVRRSNVTKIERAISELEYRPSAPARWLVTGRSNSVGVLVPDAGNVFAGAVMAGLQPAFEARGLMALFVDYRHDVSLLREKVEFLLERSVDALVVFLSEMGGGCLDCAYLATLGVPVVVVDNPLMSRRGGPGREGASGGEGCGPSPREPDPSGRGVPCEAATSAPVRADIVVDTRVDSVVVDNRRSARDVVGAMLDAGHRRVGVLALSRDTYVGAERYAGWAEAFSSRGLAVHACDAWSGPATKERGFAAASELLARGEVTALFACNYYLTLGAIKALSARRLLPGVDVGFACFDDFDFSDVLYPPLTVAGQPTGRIVEAIEGLVVRRLAGDWSERGLHVVEGSVRVTDSVRAGLAG